MACFRTGNPHYHRRATVSRSVRDGEAWVRRREERVVDVDLERGTDHDGTSLHGPHHPVQLGVRGLHLLVHRSDPSLHPSVCALAQRQLRAIGLPELVTTSLADYETLALRLAREPSLLARYRARLAANRANRPLFDMARFTHAFDDLLQAAWENRSSPMPSSIAS